MGLSIGLSLLDWAQKWYSLPYGREYWNPTSRESYSCFVDDGLMELLTGQRVGTRSWGVLLLPAWGQEGSAKCWQVWITGLTGG